MSLKIEELLEEKLSAGSAAAKSAVERMLEKLYADDTKLEKQIKTLARGAIVDRGDLESEVDAALDQ